ncbi:hypothetical protein POX_b02571 [Penicillium oxalicum]|uniref:hypothetical protein n=1 Tax=Penicillium oxalicum TaxID=69781 RepID=UPI0020B6ED94|nr:hypothetical protein POX_b02571 [Penicillium oxalicum]KAI2792533.1 hypothetical protein POX_b02571 [Penicillium oxalicum]
MAESVHPAYLSPSELGSKDYEKPGAETSPSFEPPPLDCFPFPLCRIERALQPGKVPDAFRWESYYARTLAHIAHADTEPDSQQGPADHSDVDSDADVNDEDDPGTSWFSEHNAPEKVLQFLTRRSFPLAPRNRRAGGPAPPSILDLGTGNGNGGGGLLGEECGIGAGIAAVEGHSAYRTDSEDEDEDDDEEGSEGEDTDNVRKDDGAQSTPIQFEEWDILGSKALLSETGEKVTPSPGSDTLSWFPYEDGGFDIVLDKGTFDAISLADDAQDTRVCERYPDIVRRLVKKGGYLIVTSCNWTEDELVKWFVPETKGDRTDRLSVWGRVEYPRFRFGGQEGQGVCTVCFQRVASS